MSVTYFKPGKRFTGALPNRQQQLREQVNKDNQQGKKLAGKGYTSRGFKPRDK